MSEPKKISRKQQRILLKRVVMDIHRISPGYLAARIGLSIMTAASDFIPIYFSGVLIDALVQKTALRDMLIIVLLLTGITLICKFPGYVLELFLKEKPEKLKREADMRLSEKVLNMDYIRIENVETHKEFDRIKNLTGDYWLGIQTFIVNSLEWICCGTVSVILSLIMTYRMLFDSTTGVAGIVIFAVIIITMMIENRRQAKVIAQSEEIWLSDEMNQPYRVFNHFRDKYCGQYQTAKDIHLYQQQGFLLERMEELWKKHFQVRQKNTELDVKQNLFSESLGMLRSVLIYLLAIFQALGGSVSVGSIIRNVQSYFVLQNGMNTIIGNYAYLKAAMYPMHLYYKFLDLPDEKYQGTIPTEKRNDNEYEFEFRHVWFRYPGSEQYVLRDVNLKWHIGEKMALVGRNGCGKSTLVKLLCRLYDPTKGEITLNGIDIRKYDYEEYMALFSVVFQDSHLFSFSIAENVAASMEYDSARVEDCVRRSGLSERLDSMPDGIHTCLYKDFDEHGVEISGGEAQKLCLARAIYKGSPFIVLDEPTAALDPVSEYDIYTKFNGIVGTRTAIYISHRLSSCRFCDEITVMDKGKIVERGRHDALVSAGGYYARLWKAQAEYYQDTAGELFA